MSTRPPFLSALKHSVGEGALVDTMCRASTSATEVGLQQSTFCTQMVSALPNHTNGTMAKNTPPQCIDLVNESVALTSADAEWWI